MKKMMFLIVSLICFVANVNVNAQILKDRDGTLMIMADGSVYDSADIPGANTIRPGDNVANKVSIYFMNLSRVNPEAYVREYNLYMMNPPRPVSYRNVAAVGGMGIGGGVVGGVVGGSANTGMVFSNGVMVPVQSNIQVNDMLDVSSGTSMHINVGGDSYIDGDIVSGAYRTAKAIGGLFKKKSSKATNGTKVVSNGSEYVYYNGQLLPVAKTTTTTTTATNNTTTTRSTGNGFRSGF